MNRRQFIAAGSATLLLSSGARAQDRLAAASREAIGSVDSTEGKVRAVIAWTHRNLDWTATDYQNRTPEQVLARGGGNCYEQARVVKALLEPAGVATRLTHEVNVQPPSAERARNAAALIADRGVRASVFGERHNDHVWTEYLDRELGEWVPADPTLNVIGVGSWVQARLGFGPRPVHDVIPYADMLFPIAVVVPQGQGRYEGRTERLLVEGFASHVPGVWRNPRWSDWIRGVRAMERDFVLALRDRRNFHESQPRMAALAAIYEALRSTSA